MIKFANRVMDIKGSEIRESYKIMSLPGMISLAAGSPDPKLYPIEELKDVAIRARNKGTDAFSYMATEGYGPLREKIAARMQEKMNVDCKTENIMILTGSQQGIEMSAKVFVNEGDYIACESPSYMGAFTAFNTYLPEYVGVPTDEEGMLPEELDKILTENDKVKMIYVIPNFQNPTGHTWTLERRKAFMEVVNKHEIPVIEDDPYGQIRFEGEDIPTLKSMDTKGLVVYLGSFSKILVPGYRVGWVCASDEIFQKYYLVKQGLDMHSTASVQVEINEYMEIYDLDQHIEKIRATYKKKKDSMLEAMKESFPKSVTWSKPEGGLFVWVTLPEGKNAKELLNVCIEHKVIFISGSAFYPDGGGENTFRMSFASMDQQVMVEGIRRIGEAMREFLRE